MTRPHQPNHANFRSILSEGIDWQTFPAFPPAVRLAARAVLDACSQSPLETGVSAIAELAILLRSRRVRVLKLLEDVIAHNAVIVRDFNRGQFIIVGLAVTSGVNVWTPLPPFADRQIFQRFCH